jgi:hypothetical protein
MEEWQQAIVLTSLIVIAPDEFGVRTEARASTVSAAENQSGPITPCEQEELRVEDSRYGDRVEQITDVALLRPYRRVTCDHPLIYAGIDQHRYVASQRGELFETVTLEEWRVERVST